MDSRRNYRDCKRRKPFDRCGWRNRKTMGSCQNWIPDDASDRGAYRLPTKAPGVGPSEPSAFAFPQGLAGRRCFAASWDRPWAVTVTRLSPYGSDSTARCCWCLFPCWGPTACSWGRISCRVRFPTSADKSARPCSECPVDRFPDWRQAVGLPGRLAGMRVEPTAYWLLQPVIAIPNHPAKKLRFRSRYS